MKKIFFITAITLFLLGFKSQAQDTINYGDPGFMFPQGDSVKLYSAGSSGTNFLYGPMLEHVSGERILGLSLAMPYRGVSGITMMLLKYLGTDSLMANHLYINGGPPVYSIGNPLDNVYQVIDSVRIPHKCDPICYIRFRNYEDTNYSIRPVFGERFHNAVVLDSSVYFVVWWASRDTNYPPSSVYDWSTFCSLTVTDTCIRGNNTDNRFAPVQFVRSPSPCFFPITDSLYCPPPDRPCLPRRYCEPVSGLNVEVETRVAHISWNSDDEHCKYELAYGDASQPVSTYTIVEFTDTTYNFVGLDMTTTYACRVRGVCCEDDGDSTWSSDWSAPVQFRRPTCLVRALSNVGNWGHVLGGGHYDIGSEALLVAVPENDNFQFVCWNDGDVNDHRTITVTQDTLFRAYFEQVEQTAVPTVAPLTFTLSPNPTGSLLYVTIPNGTAIEMPGGGTRAEIFDDRGRKVADYKFHTSKFEIEVSTLPDGHYTLRLSSGKKVGTKGFVKQR